VAGRVPRARALEQRARIALGQLAGERVDARVADVGYELVPRASA
jgi:hypothetical protein